MAGPSESSHTEYTFRYIVTEKNIRPLFTSRLEYGADRPISSYPTRARDDAHATELGNGVVREKVRKELADSLGLIPEDLDVERLERTLKTTIVTSSEEIDL